MPKLDLYNYLLIALAAYNLIVFLFYAVDKLCAVKDFRRISEKRLITMTLFCGGIGALVGMMLCRHKIRKFKFWFFAIVASLLEVALLYVILEQIVNN